MNVTRCSSSLLAVAAALVSAGCGGVYDEPAASSSGGGSGSGGSGAAVSSTSSSSGGATSSSSGGGAPSCASGPWALRFGADLDQNGQALAVDAACNVYFSATTTGAVDLGNGPLQGKFYQGTVLAKLDAGGGTVWSRWLESDDGAVRAGALAVDAGGDLLVSGVFLGTNDFGTGPLTAVSPHGDVFVARLDPQGSAVWVRQFTATNGFEVYGGPGLAVGPSGEVVVTGSFEGTVDFGGGPLTSFGLDIFVVRLAPSGETLWSERFGGPGNTLDEVASVAVSPTGEILLAGDYEGALDFGNGPLSFSHGGTFVAALDAEGKARWSHALPAACGFGGCPVRVAYDPAGQAVIVGANPYDPALPDASPGLFQRVFDSQGATVLTRELAGFRAWGSRSDGTGGWLVAGQLEGGVVTRLDAIGAPMWTRGALSSDNTGDQVASAVALDPAGHVVVIGSFQGNIDFGGAPLQSAGGHDLFVARLPLQ
jgi:hypothetical protein